MSRTRSRWIAPSIKRSTYEDRLLEELDDRQANFEYETERFVYTVERSYVPDFIFRDKRLLVEAKGYFTPEDRSKILKALPAIREAGWELRFVFQRAQNKLNKRSKTTYAAWCDKHGFIWAEGMIPKDWYAD